MSNYAIRFNVDMAVTCAISGAMIYTGFYLNGTSQHLIVSTDVYQQQYRNQYPQINKIITISKALVSQILGHRGTALPVGYLIGEKVTAMQGEDERYECQDFILTPINSQYRYSFQSKQDKLKYDRANFAKKIIGKFIVDAPMQGSRMEDEFRASMAHKMILLIIRGENYGEQRATIQDNNATHEIGVFVK